MAAWCDTKVTVILVDAQVDLRHMDEKAGSNVVEVGVDLSEFYMSVEWDILEVPAVRWELSLNLILNLILPCWIIFISLWLSWNFVAKFFIRLGRHNVFPKLG